MDRWGPPNSFCNKGYFCTFERQYIQYIHARFAVGKCWSGQPFVGAGESDTNTRGRLWFVNLTGVRYRTRTVVRRVRPCKTSYIIIIYRTGSILIYSQVNPENNKTF